MDHINFVLVRRLSFLVVSPSHAFADDRDELGIGWQKYACFFVPEDNAGEFVLVEPESELFEVGESPEEFVFIDCQDGIDRVVMSQGIFDEPFSGFDEDP
jgi:hypothetical protein